MSAPAENTDVKGKGKDTEPETTDVSMEAEDSSSDEEIVEVSRIPPDRVPCKSID